MLLMDLMKQMELNWWNGKGGIDGINETHGIDGMETRKECYLVYGNHGIDEADRINHTDEILEYSGMVTMDLTVLLE